MTNERTPGTAIGLESSFAEIDWSGRRVRIEYQTVAGPAGRPLVVFLHEGLGSVSTWRDFPARLCREARCRGLVYSRPGYGRSTPRAAHERWQPDFMHRQAHEVLPALLAELGVGPEMDELWLFGHSDGGSISLIYAAQRPAELAGCIVLAPHIKVEELSIRSIAAARVAYEHGDLRERFARHHEDADSAFYGWNDAWLDPAFRSWSIEEEISAIRCPLLAMQGVNDEYGTLEQIRGIRRRVPHALLIELPDCGHSPQRDRPDKTLAAARDFIAAHSVG